MAAAQVTKLLSYVCWTHSISKLLSLFSLQTPFVFFPLWVSCFEELSLLNKQLMKNKCYNFYEPKWEIAHQNVDFVDVFSITTLSDYSPLKRKRNFAFSIRLFRNVGSFLLAYTSLKCWSLIIHEGLRVVIHIIREFPFRDLKNVIKSLLSSCLSGTSFKHELLISGCCFNSLHLRTHS